MYQFNFDSLVTQILKESQTFNFKDHKARIIDYIKNKINNENRLVQPPDFYKILRNTGKIGDAKPIGFTDEEVAAWKKYFTNDSFFSWEGGWSQRNFGIQYAKKTGQNRTLNYYGTLSKNKNNILKFWKAFPDLCNKLNTLSSTNQTPIKIKTHYFLDSMVTDNDNFKIYFYDTALKNDIENIVKEWSNTNNVELSERSHTFGVDTGNSFGQIVEAHIKKAFDDLLEKNGNKYTPEQYYEWLTQNIVTLIKQVKPKEYT